MFFYAFQFFQFLGFVSALYLDTHGMSSLQKGKSVSNKKISISSVFGPVPENFDWNLTVGGISVFSNLES